jgi:hypothetical protein
MIPRVLHLWWHDRDVPSWVVESRDRWQHVHPHWAVTLWCDEPASVVQAVRANDISVVAEDRVRHCANVMRWNLLWKIGGVWVDCDTEPLRAFDPLLREDTPFCGSLVRPEATVIGGPPGHRLWRELILASARRSSPTTAPKLSGAYALARAIDRVGGVRVLEPGAFFDHDSDGTPIPEPPEGRWCRHDWRTSSTRQAAH